LNALQLITVRLQYSERQQYLLWLISLLQLLSFVSLLLKTTVDGQRI
jgi:hypothetical protein